MSNTARDKRSQTGVRLVTVAAILVSLAVFNIGLAYYGRTSLCLLPPHIVSDRERIENAIEALAELAEHKPELLTVHHKSCCSIVSDRSAGDYGVTLRSVASSKWVELVSVRYGPNGSKTAIVPSDRCGRAVRAN